MATAILGIQGMTCEHCVKRVTEGLSSVAGASDVKVSLENNQAEVAYDSEETLANLREKIVDLGYTLA